MDMSETTAPKSDQQNFDDYIGGPKTVTVSEVKAGSTEQPVEVHLVEFPGRPFKPSKSMRRVLVAAWGADSGAYVGRQMTLFGDPEVRFGGQAVGGIRISHLSHIPKPLTVSLTVTRGKRAPFVVQPLAVRDWLTELADTGGDVDLIGALGNAAIAAKADADVIGKIRGAYQKAQTVDRGEIATDETEEE
jgi:hypothetical protein